MGALFFFQDVFIYLKGTITGRDTDSFYSWFTPQMTLKARLNQTKAKNSIQDSMGSKGPST